KGEVKSKSEMADLTITAKYNSSGARVCLWICMFFSPFWAVLCPLVAAVYTAMLVVTFVPFLNFFHASITTAGQLAAVVGPGLAFWFISAAGAALALSMADNRIIASENGLRVPIFLSASTLFRNHIPWQKITSMQINGNPEKGIDQLELRIVAADLGKIK